MMRFLTAVLLSLPLQAWAVEGRPLAEGRGSGVVTPLKVEVDSEADWAFLWARHDAGRGLARPAVDFSRDRVSAEFLGGPEAAFSMRAALKLAPALTVKPARDHAGLRQAEGKIKVLLRVNNDFIIPPAGLLAFAADPHVGDIDAKGMDVGYTHGTELEVGKTDAKGRTYKLHAGTNLYTMANGKPSGHGKDGHPVIPIYFTEENVFSGSVDNFESRRGLLWKAGAGVQVLNSDHRSALGAAGQQAKYHKAIKAQGKQPEYIYQADGLGVRMAPYVDAALGMYRALGEKWGSLIESQAYVEPRIFPTNDQSAVKVHGDVSAGMKKKKSEARMSVGADATGHKGGVEVAPVVSLTYERKKWGLENKVVFPIGKPVNSVHYNWDKSPWTSLALYAFIGR